MIAIDDLYSREEMAREINNQDKIFNIYDFCLQDEFSDERKSCAIGMITPKQSFTCFSRYLHQTTTECILFTLYDDYNDVYEVTNGEWHEMVYRYNDICIQYMYSKDLSLFYIIVYLPNEINKFQYSKLFELYDSIKKINDYFKINNFKEIEVYCGYREKKSLKSLSLEETIIFMKDKITLEETREEIEIVSKKEQMARNLVKRRKKVEEYAQKTY
ncbi:MAG: hypothetical protein IKG27_04795 [Bacilli bacterium]|nr:hypothetical protein [Bacilli bacterium]